VGSLGSADARSMALGNEFTVISSGVYSVGRNPANLALDVKHKVEVATVLPLPNVSAIGGSNFLSVEDFNYFFTENGGADPNLDPNTNNSELFGNELTVSDKHRLLALFSNDNRIHTKVSNTIFAMSYYGGERIGGFAFSIHDQAAVTSNIPKDLVDLVLFGNQPGRVYNLNETRFDAWLLRSYSLSYALDISNFLPVPFKSLRGGISIKYISGMAYASLRMPNTSLMTGEDYFGINVQSEVTFRSAMSPDFGMTYDFEEGSKESNISPFPEPVGSGFGFDLGVTSDINDRLTVGLSVTDMGSINWDSETVEYASTTNYILDDLTESEVVDSVFDNIIGDGQYVDGYSTGLSTALHLGGSYIVGTMDKKKFTSILLVTVGYHQGFNNLPGNSTNPRFTIGLEWQVAKWFDLRTGTSLGGRDDINWALGFGIDASVLEFHFATTDMTGPLGSSSNKIVSVSMGTRWKF
jgi:hypothetical protein